MTGRTLGVVVVHRPNGTVAELPSVRDLVSQVDQLLIVVNGDEGHATIDAAGSADDRIGVLRFSANRGTAAAWNAALCSAIEGGHRYLYLLDQDSTPLADAVTTARAEISSGGVAAVVQPAGRDKLRLISFPWNTVASGSLYDVDILQRVGGFDERLFVDEVDHEMLSRLMLAGYGVKSLAVPTIRHQVGSPRAVRLLGRQAWVLGHSIERNRLRGYSTGLLVRRYIPRSPGTSARLVLREAVIAAKDLAGGEAGSARARLWGLATGAATTQPPARAAERACPYCAGPLLGRFGAVPDWLFANGSPSDVYECARCGALAAGTVPDVEQVASWYSNYYTHALEPAPSRLWSSFWPTPRRRRELERMDRYFAHRGEVGRFLDVGTGSGARLIRFAAEGWDVVGQDLDPKAGHLASEQGLPVHHCAVDDLVGREKPFDLIGLSHVLEHATDPAGLLGACASLLAPNGRICVICPNAHALGRRLFGRWWYGLDQPRHLAIPSLESLARLTSALGLKVVHVMSSPTNAAVILGGSLARGLENQVAPSRFRRGAGFCLHFLGQAMGRAATMLSDRLGEEVIWVGERPGP